MFYTYREERDALPCFVSQMTQKFIPPFTIILILSLAYGSTLAPGLSWANGAADGGDLIAAAATGGVAHPPGYPLYMLSAQLFQTLPLGKLAFRTNLFSAVCTLLACILVYKFLEKNLEGRPHARWIALVSALAFGLAPQVWSQAVITEVYGLHSLLIILFLLALYANHFPAGDFGRGLLLGLAAGNHLTALFLVPLLFLDYISQDSPITTWQVILRRSAGLMAGLTIYLTLPLRAMLAAPVNWYNPVTLQNFMSLISVQVYESYLFNLTPTDTILRIRGLAGLLLDQFTLPGVFLGLYGLFSRLPRALLLTSSWIFIINSVFAVIYGSYDSYIYLLPAYLAFAFWLAFGLHDLLNGFLVNKLKFRKVILVLLVLGLLARAPFYILTVDASRDGRAEDFGQHFLNNAPAGAIVLAREDREIFALWYFHYAIGQRQDVIVIAEGLLQFDWYLHTLTKTYPSLIIPSPAPVLAADLITANPARSVCNIDELGNCR
jgi:hypothetical protein